MNRPTGRSASASGPLRIAGGLLLVVAVTLPVACGSSTTPAATPAPTAKFVQALHDQLPQPVRDRGVLRVGTEASYAPMESFGPDGRTIIGAEPDLGAAMGRVLGVRLQFVDIDFTDLVPKVTGGDLDLALSAMTDTPERSKITDFVDYFSAGTTIIVQRGNPAGVTGISDLCGKIVATQRGTTQEDLLARSQKNCGKKPIIVKKFPTNADTLVELRTARAVAVLNDLPAAVFLVNDPHTSSSYQLASTTQYEPGLYGIVVAKNQPRLRDAVQGALEELLRSGVYAHVLSRWHVQAGAVTKITVNSNL
jgi:polar amino acid transport system substrate-binding protein